MPKVKVLSNVSVQIARSKKYHFHCRGAPCGYPKDRRQFVKTGRHKACPYRVRGYCRRIQIYHNEQIYPGLSNDTGGHRFPAHYGNVITMSTSFVKKLCIDDIWSRVSLIIFHIFQIIVLLLTWQLNSSTRHAGLDPASSAFLDSRLRGNDSFKVFNCRSNNIERW